MYWWESYCRELLELNPSGSLAARVEWKGERAGVLTHQLLSVICRRLLSVGTWISKHFWLPRWKQNRLCLQEEASDQRDTSPGSWKWGQCSPECRGRGETLRLQRMRGNGASVHQSVKGEGKPSGFKGWESSHISNTKLLWPITWMMNRKPKWAQCG